MPGLFPLVVAPFEVETAAPNTPSVHRHRVRLAVAQIVGDHLAAARERDEGSVFSSDPSLEFPAVAADPAHLTLEAADSGHSESASDLDMVPAGEVLVLLVPFPPRRVDVTAAESVRVVTGHSLQSRDIPLDSKAHRVHQDRPTTPELLDRPWGKRLDRELRSSRVDSQALAASTTTRHRIWRSVRVFLSM